MSEQQAPAEVAASPETTHETAKTGRGGARRASGRGRAKAARKTAAAKKSAVSPRQAATKGKRAGNEAPAARTDTKQTQLIAMLRAPDGATIDDVVKVFGWQPHTARGAIYGALKKKLGLKVESEKVEGRGRVYRIVD